MIWKKDPILALKEFRRVDQSGSAPERLCARASVGLLRSEGVWIKIAKAFVAPIRILTVPTKPVGRCFDQMGSTTEQGEVVD
jgi:hypothetical protein